MNVLSLFDGIACARVALGRAGVKVTNYWASEIDKHTMKVANTNHPDTAQVGDVTMLRIPKGYHVDLLAAGSPCQGFSFAGKGLNFDDPRSKLFFEFVRVLKECRRYNPDVKFFLENVVMKKQFQDVISDLLGVSPIMVNSALVSAQKRKRLYWTNIEGFVMPEDRGIIFSDVIKDSYPGAMRGRRIDDNGTRKDYDMSIPAIQRIEIAENGKANCLTTVEKDNVVVEDNFQGLVPGVDFRYLTLQEIDRAEFKHSAQTWKSGNRMGSVSFPTDLTKKAKCVTSTQIVADRASNHVQDQFGIRMLTPEECEVLQGLPVGYTAMIPKTQRIKAIGNGWQIDTIVEFFKLLKP